MCAYAIIAKIGFEAEKDICFDSVLARVLQSIRTNFVRQTDAATLLPHVKDNAFANGFNFAQSRRQLIAAITAQTSERVARQTLRMNAHENIFFAGNVAFDNRQMTFAVKRALLSLEPKTTVLAGKVDVGNFFHEGLRALAILNQIANGDDV